MPRPTEEYLMRRSLFSNLDFNTLKELILPGNHLILTVNKTLVLEGLELRGEGLGFDLGAVGWDQGFELLEEQGFDYARGGRREDHLFIYVLCYCYCYLFIEGFVFAGCWFVGEWEMFLVEVLNFVSK
jgi:hypothetical protein